MRPTPTHPSAKATPDNWMYPPWGGWTRGQVEDLWLPFDWEMLDGVIAVRPLTTQWHDMVRDRLFLALREAARWGRLEVGLVRRVAVDERTLITPDVIVYETPDPGPATGPEPDPVLRLDLGLDLDLDPAALPTPVANVSLVVEVVAPESRTEDRYRKPGILADAGVPYYWRAERGDDAVPVVHEFDGRPGRRRWTEYRGTLVTRTPFRVDIDLRSLIEL